MSESVLNPLHPHREQVVDHALGNLIRILSTLLKSEDPADCLSASEFREWFLERFEIEADSCSSKTFGDAISFGIRLGLIPIGKTVRTRSKRIFYTGTTPQLLNDAWGEWRRSQAPTSLVSAPLTVERISATIDGIQDDEAPGLRPRMSPSHHPVTFDPLYEEFGIEIPQLSEDYAYLDEDDEEIDF